MTSQTPSWILKIVNIRVRLLPIVIFSATLLLTVKVISVWKSFQASFSVSPLQASEASKEDPSKKTDPSSKKDSGESHKEKKEDTPLPQETNPSKESKDQTTQASHVKEKNSPTKEEAPALPKQTSDQEKKEKPFDPLDLTASEVKILQELAKRRDQISLREKELSSKEVTLNAVEARLDTKLNELKEVKRKIEEAFDKDDEKQKIKLDKLVKLYEGMKPKDAAKIMQDLHVEVVVRILEQMKEKLGSLILSKMDPENARFITAKLVERRRLAQVLEDKSSDKKN